MLSKLKVRTGLLLVLALLSLTALGTALLGWFNIQQSSHDLDRLDGLASQQVRHVKNAYIGSLRAVINIDSALAIIDRGAQQEQIAVARNHLRDANEAFERYMQAPASSEQAERFRKTLSDSFKSYIATVEQMAGAVAAGDGQRYLQIKSNEATLASMSLVQTMSEFDSFTADTSAGLVQSARQRAALMGLVLLGICALVLAAVAGSYLFLTRQVVRPLNQAGQLFDRIAAGDLTQRVDHRSGNEIGQLFAALKRMQDSLTRTVSQVRRGVDEINVGSREIAAGNTDLSSRTEQQAASLEETAASMEELAGTVRQNADNARQANQLAASSMEVAQRGGAAVSEVVHTMQEISASSRKISEIVSVIDGIAFQTNILALNAAVEAARAGEQGKGFAVVAGEVRSLAQRSAQAAKEIKGLIEDSVNKVGAGSQQVERAGTTMQEIVSSVKRVTDIMGEISAASQEQSTGIEQVNRAVAQMDEVTQQNAALVEEAAAAAASLQEQAARLAEAVSVFKLNAGEVIEVRSQLAASQPAAPAQLPAASAGALGAPAAARPETGTPALAAGPKAAAQSAAPAKSRAAPIGLAHAGAGAAAAVGAPAQETATSAAQTAVQRRRERAAQTQSRAGVQAPPAEPVRRPARRTQPAEDDWESF
ncbi:methyl-accepting chemotaxis protein [Orrella sp. JC864]|uniref:methyl-accepting chemotaxis protein n=1 Tax=Orrella sp. JC864 TaxID=3120298 RepID=UPI00300B672D